MHGPQHRSPHFCLANSWKCNQEPPHPASRVGLFVCLLVCLFWKSIGLIRVKKSYCSFLYADSSSHYVHPQEPLRVLNGSQFSRPSHLQICRPTLSLWPLWHCVTCALWETQIHLYNASMSGLHPLFHSHFLNVVFCCMNWFGWLYSYSLMRWHLVGVCAFFEHSRNEVLQAIYLTIGYGWCRTHWEFLILLYWTITTL
jgi:hypothetical protein